MHVFIFSFSSQAKISGSGGVELVLDALVLHMSEVHLVEYACWAVMVLSENNEATQVRRMSHVTCINESCHAYELSHGTCMNESCHTYE